MRTTHDIETRRFADYCLSFYGRGGLYAFRPPMKHTEAVWAYNTLKRADEAGELGWGDGDSVDRERARDLVLLKRGKSIVGFGPSGPSTAETGIFARIFKKYGKARRR